MATELLLVAESGKLIKTAAAKSTVHFSLVPLSKQESRAQERRASNEIDQFRTCLDKMLCKRFYDVTQSGRPLRCRTQMSYRPVLKRYGPKCPLSRLPPFSGGGKKKKNNFVFFFRPGPP